jgi:hypothetical protein
MPGMDGAIETEVGVRLTQTRADYRVMRCRPGTFEWRFGRDRDETVLYHAGVQFADLMERAGAADARSVNFESAGGGAWRGLPDGRVAALDRLKPVLRDLGLASSHRLTRYCVRGETTAEIAHAFAVAERDMAAALKIDLRGLAQILRLV